MNGKTLRIEGGAVATRKPFPDRRPLCDRPFGCNCGGSDGSVCPIAGTMRRKKHTERNETMKIALPSRQNRVDEHFGHCEYFTVFTVNERNEIIAEETVSAPANCGCKSNIAQTLAAMGVKMMLAGNMGQGAVNVLNGCGIQVLRGCSGDVKTVAREWLAGSLRDSGTACALHEHGCHEN